MSAATDLSCGSSTATSASPRSGYLDAIRTEKPHLRRCRTTRRPRNPVPPNTATVRWSVTAMAQPRDHKEGRAPMTGKTLTSRGATRDGHFGPKRTLHLRMGGLIGSGRSQWNEQHEIGANGGNGPC